MTPSPAAVPENGLGEGEKVPIEEGCEEGREEAVPVWKCGLADVALAMGGRFVASTSGVLAVKIEDIVVLGLVAEAMLPLNVVVFE